MFLFKIYCVIPFAEHSSDQELLAGAVSQAAAAVMLLHFLQVRVIRQEFREMRVRAERVQVGEHHVAFRMAGIGNLQVLRVGEHLAVNLLLHRLRVVGHS